MNFIPDILFRYSFNEFVCTKSKFVQLKYIALFKTKYMNFRHEQTIFHSGSQQGGLHSQILENNAQIKAIYSKFVSLSALIPFKKANKQFWNISPSNKNRSSDKLKQLQKTKNQSQSKMVQKEMERRVKKYKRKRLFQFKAPQEDNQSYLQTYNHYLQNSSSIRSKIYSESKQVSLGLPEGICQYSLLNNYPTIVQYVVKKIRAKNKNNHKFSYQKFKEPQLKKQLEKGQLFLKNRREQIRRKRILNGQSPKSINTTRQTAQTQNTSECYQLVNEIINSSRVTLKKVKINLPKTPPKILIKRDKPQRSYTQIVNDSDYS